MVALTLHGELLCNQDYPRFNPGFGLEKLKATALRRGSRGADALLRLFFVSPERMPRDVRKKWKEAIGPVRRFSFWSPILES